MQAGQPLQVEMPLKKRRLKQKGREGHARSCRCCETLGPPKLRRSRNTRQPSNPLNLVPPSEICGDAGNALADYQSMNVVRALVCIDRFEVVHVPHNAV